MIRTKQRELLLETIRSMEEHPTADELFQIVRRELPMISLATIYRNLNYMVEEGLVRRIAVSGMPDRFDRCLEAHDHMICDRCGGLFDFKLSFDLGSEIERSVGGPISGYALIVRGCCPACREN
ncbi:MAG: transcriptional repressor [Butyricicoccus sp.]|nr:transcriptional repressor [Butyricicoccus sp.]MBQ8584931.1 transcriptional repressor [Butyricicoccus sp.]